MLETPPVQAMGKGKGKSKSESLKPNVALSTGNFPQLGEEEIERRVFSEFSKRLTLSDQQHPPSSSNLQCQTESEQQVQRPPEHSCSYCTLSSPESVVKCTTCSRWFCNHSSNGSASHIINHLVRSRHKEVSLHPDSPLGDSVLECYNCGCKNVFILGFIPAKADSVVILLCRQPCVQNGSTDQQWDTSKWQPIIEDRSFLPWLVAHPSKEDVALAIPVTIPQMNHIEEAWKEKPSANREEIEQMKLDEPDHVKINYESTEDYFGIFAPLVKLEADYDRMFKESQKQENVSVRWDVGLNMKRMAWFTLTSFESGIKILPGDELLLTNESYAQFKSNSKDKKWSCSCLVTKVPLSLSDEIAVEVDTFDVPTEITTGFTIEFVWKPTPYIRMFLALKSFNNDPKAISTELKSKLLSPSSDISTEHLYPDYTVSIPRKISVPSLTADLNHSQIQAVCEALQRPLSLIQGPPGTGKTVTSATLIYHMVNLKLGPILVCAPSNVAVDQLTEKIHQTGVRVIRMTSKSREGLETSVSHLSLHTLVKKADFFPDLKKLFLLKEKFDQMSPKDEAKFKHLVSQTEKMLLSQAEVICCTCIVAGDARLSGMKFRTVVIDEATQACEPECLIPFTLGAERAILIGDHQQLGPVIMCKKAARANFSQSMFERLVLSGLKPFRLQVQYRMHPCLSEFPSNTFYEGSLQNGVTAVERTNYHAAEMNDFPWPRRGTPMFFHVNLGHEEISASGTSFLNRVEAMSCEKFVTKLLKSGVNPSCIGVITPYEGQRTFLINYMSQNGSLDKSLYEGIEVASVDAFQGREKDYIILSCVRSNDYMGIGFLSDYRRLNVALTRAKYGLIILGNAMVLSKHNLWYHLLMHFKDKGLMVEGPVTNLRLSLVVLSRPRSRSSKNAKVSLDREEHVQTSLCFGEISAESILQDQFSLFDALSQATVQETVLYRAPGHGRPISPSSQGNFLSFTAVDRLAQESGFHLRHDNY